MFAELYEIYLLHEVRTMLEYLLGCLWQTKLRTHSQDGVAFRSLRQWDDYLTFGERGIVISEKCKKAWNYSMSLCIAQLAGQCTHYGGLVQVSLAKYSSREPLDVVSLVAVVAWNYRLGVNCRPKGISVESKRPELFVNFQKTKHTLPFAHLLNGGLFTCSDVFLCDGSQWKLAKIKLRQFNRAVKALDL